MTDDEVAAADFDYQDWTTEDTFLVSGPLPGTKAALAGIGGTVRTRREALIWAVKTFGKRLVMPVAHPHRWCFRVRKIPTPAMETV